jgi:orotidine-5'-phosphate decarboxylase
MPDGSGPQRSRLAGRPSTPAECVIVALDAASTEANLSVVTRLSGHARWFKLGMRQFYADGQTVIRAIRQAEAQLFLDLKLHDIPHTVATAIESLGPIHPELLTIHAAGGPAMIEEARAAVDRLGLSTRILAVTVLTSLSEQDLSALGMVGSTGDIAVRWGRMAVDAGAHGVVSSGHEASRMRQSIGSEPLIVTPGIRLPGDAAGDQQRIMTPGEATMAGASHIVVGRPVIGAAAPLDALGRIFTDIERTQREMGRRHPQATDSGKIA